MVFKNGVLILLTIAGMTILHGKTLHVSQSGGVGGSGEADSPFARVNEAAQAAQPGDTVLVHAGVYREWVQPARGGEGESRRIVYRAVPGDSVVIKGSERFADWKLQPDGTWKAELDIGIFGGYNPFVVPLANRSGSRLGEVYLDSRPLEEAKSLAGAATRAMTWKAAPDGRTIVANFGSANPNLRLAEINVRKQIFAPARYNLGSRYSAKWGMVPCFSTTISWCDPR